jgi:hypothetical protein
MGRLLKIIPFIVILFIVTIGYAQPRTPLEIVELFHKCYGNPCMDEVSDYTTPRFRDNKPKSVWVADTWKALHKMNYKKLNSALLDSKVKGDKAVVIVNVKISTVGGDASQKEIFYLVREGEKWLIDELVVTDEKVDVNKIQL